MNNFIWIKDTIMKYDGRFDYIKLILLIINKYRNYMVKNLKKFYRIFKLLYLNSCVIR